MAGGSGPDCRETGIHKGEVEGCLGSDDPLHYQFEAYPPPQKKKRGGGNRSSFGKIKLAIEGEGMATSYEQLEPDCSLHTTGVLLDSAGLSARKPVQVINGSPQPERPVR